MNTPDDLKAYDFSCLPGLAGHLLCLAHLHATALCTKQLHAHNIKPKGWVLLEFISNNPEASQKDIAKVVGSKEPVVVRMIDNFEERGLAQRVQSTRDGRIQNVRLTDAGQALLPTLRAIALDVETQYQQETALTDTEYQMLMILLRKVTGRG